MARDKNGYILLHSTILDKDFSPVSFKIFVGLLLLANHRKAPIPGLIDLSLRDIAKKLKLSLGALIKARNKFVEEERIELVHLTSKTNPILGIRILNYQFYQEGKNVLQNEQSTKKVPPSEQSNKECSFHRTKDVHSMIQKVPPSEQSISPGEQSRAYSTPLINSKKTKEGNIYNYKRNKDAENVWKKALIILKKQVNKANYTTWLQNTVGLGYQDNQFIVQVPNEYVGDHLDKNQRSLIENVLREVTREELEVVFVGSWNE